MMYLLDTDHISILQRKTEPQCSQLASRLSKIDQHEIYVPIISFHEQVNGWNGYLKRAKSGSETIRAYSMFESILADFGKLQVVSFNEVSAECFNDFRRKKVRVGTMDLRIASIAISRNMLLLTRNSVDFDRVPGLHHEDWCI